MNTPRILSHGFTEIRLLERDGEFVISVEHGGVMGDTVTGTIDPILQKIFDFDLTIDNLKKQSSRHFIEEGTPFSAYYYFETAIPATENHPFYNFVQ